MYDYQGKTALITGASSGIGAAFAQELAQRGMHLILVARSEERLRTMASELTQKYGHAAEVIAADLSSEQGVALVKQEVEQRGLSVDLLINNAGFGKHGRFDEIAPENDQQEIMLNVAALVALSHAFIPAMAARGEGAVINIGSLASFFPMPYFAVYSATKAFVLSFTTALSEEYRTRGVRIFALCPGVTETSFFDVAGHGAAYGPKRSTAQVVATGLKALEGGRRVVVVDGASNVFMSLASRLASRATQARMIGNGIRPR